MGCRNTNKTKEEVLNIIQSGGEFMTPLLNQTQEETDLRFQHLKSIVDLKSDKYYIYGSIPISSRVSEVAKRKAQLPEKSLSKDDDIRRAGGTFIHELMKDLVDHYNNEGSVENIRRIREKAFTSVHKLATNHFLQLDMLAKEIVSTIKEQQKQIDPKGKVKIYTEQFITDLIKNVGGTLDIVAIFSDNTASVYDYKTSGRNNAIGYSKNAKVVVNNLFPFYDIRAYDLAMTEYKRILLERVGVKSIRQSRLIPIAVDYKWKQKADIETGDTRLPELSTLIAVQPESDYMKPIPTGGEQSRWEGINKVLEKQYKQLASLSDQLKTPISVDAKERIKMRIANIEKSIIKTLVDEDVHDLINTIITLTKEVKTRLAEPKIKQNGEVNGAYLSDIDIKNFRNEMMVYDDIIRETHSYFEDLKKENPTSYDKLKTELYNIRPFFEQVLMEIDLENEQRSTDGIPKEFKDENGHLLPFDELTFSQITFLKLSEINNPIFREIWKLIEDAQYEIKDKFNKMDDVVFSKLEALLKYADTNHMTRQQVFDLMINYQTGNMYSKLDRDFFNKLSKAFESKTPEDIKFIKDHYEFKDKEKWKKEYNERLDAEKRIQRARFNFNTSTNKFENTVDLSGKIIASAKKQQEAYEKKIEQWIIFNDLEHSSEAWLNKTNRKRYLNLKDNPENYSAEYRKISSIAPVREFYDMWHDYIDEFSEILGISDFRKMPPNFIPNIRKEMIEYISRDGFHLASAVKEFIDSFNVREEDKYIAKSNEEGIIREIPILFINKFFTKDGKLDTSRKSFDLSTSLMIFGRMAYNYKYMSEIEPKINALKTLFGEPSPEQGGIQIKNKLSQRIKGKVQPYLTKEGRHTETYKLLEDITDLYLYGIKYKEGTMIPGFDTVHFLSKLKNFNAALKLSFAIVPSAGAFTAGKLGTYFQGKKGIFYNGKQLQNAYKWIITESKKYDLLTDFFDAENDDYLERDLQKHRISWKNRLFRSRTGFGLLRRADKSIISTILVAMSQNYGITKEGTIIRFKKGIDASRYKTIWDASEIENGKLSVKGLTKEGYKQFRAAVKSVASEIIGNMNPEDIGKIDTNLLMNQAMAFRSWMPAVVRERVGGLVWNETTQAMKWGRYMAYLSEYKANYTPQEIEDGKLFVKYAQKILIPNVSKLILDITTFGLAPKMGMQRINIERAKREFLKWQLKNPNLKDKVTFDDFLEIKEGQMKAMLVELRAIIGVMTLALFLAGSADDGEKRYYKNFVTRNIYKIFSKAGSELTFMWNPTEFERLMKNPFPITSLLTLFKNTVKNGLDETRDFVVGENSNQDKSPALYYLSQWMYGGPQLIRFFEVFENMKKSPYQVFQL